MLTLEACKAMGYPQDGYLRLVPDLAHGGEPFLSCTTAGWTEHYACPDSIDALDWMAAQFGGTWQRDADFCDFWLFAPQRVYRRADTPSALIVAVAQVLA